jgi:glyoxylase-like metal-dependent hydrolase (beta-lactamase superfamily II)
MIHLHSFTFSPFAENTYVLWNDHKQAVIIDPGCYDRKEEAQLKQFVEDNSLSVVDLWFTHTHIDHVFGHAFVHRTWGFQGRCHPKDIVVWETMPRLAEMYLVQYTSGPKPISNFEDGLELMLGDERFQILHAPGHSPGSVCFYSESNNLLIGGDVLFYQSIGRSDLPLGDQNELVHSIKTKLYILPDQTLVYSGHGPSTSIGFEKKNNPFVRL